MKARVTNHGSIVLFDPLDVDAQEWVDEHVDGNDVQVWGNSAIAVEPRYINALVAGFIDAGGELN